MKEHVSVQFRAAEFFKVFDRANFGLPDNLLGCGGSSAGAVGVAVFVLILAAD